MKVKTAMAAASWCVMTMVLLVKSQQHQVALLTMGLVVLATYGLGLLLSLMKVVPDTKEPPLPPSPPRWLPLVGHLHLVGHRAPHVSLRDLDASYGQDGLLLVRLATVPTLVVSSPAAVEAVTRLHDRDLASRPPCTAAQALFHGRTDVAFSSYGEDWRTGRKALITHMLSPRRVAAQMAGRAEELLSAVSSIRDAAAAGRAVDLTELLYTYSTNVACRAISRSFFQSPDRTPFLRELIHDTAALVAFNLDDYFPMMGLFSRSMRNRAGNIRKRWDEVLERVIADHHAAAADNQLVQQEEDFVGAILTHQLSTDELRALIVDVFFGGTDTSYTLLEYAMAELMKNPRVMSTLREQLGSSVPAGEMVGEGDLAAVPYLRAVVMETLRLHPPAPLLAPHFSMKKVQIGSFQVPRDVAIIINAWALGRDPSLWEHAEEFLPERFLAGEDGAAVRSSFNGTDCKFLPFGAGRRMCPGIGFSIPSLEGLLANLVHHFIWDLPPEAAGRINMQENFCLTLTRKERLMLVPTAAVGAADA